MFIFKIRLGAAALRFAIQLVLAALITSSSMSCRDKDQEVTTVGSTSDYQLRAQKAESVAWPATRVFKELERMRRRISIEISLSRHEHFPDFLLNSVSLLLVRGYFVIEADYAWSAVAVLRAAHKTFRPPLKNSSDYQTLETQR